MIFDSPFFMELLLPFLLVFVLIFAILQKSKILGDGKAQIDALVSLAIALIVIAIPGPRDIVVNLMPWLAVAVAVVLVFLIIYGFVAGDLTKTPTWMKVVFGILAGVFTIGVVLYVSGLWDTVSSYFSSGNQELWMSIVMLVIIGGAIAVAVSTGKKNGSSKSSDDD